jgi:hypothetical protein
MFIYDQVLLFSFLVRTEQRKRNQLLYLDGFLSYTKEINVR